MQAQAAGCQGAVGLVTNGPVEGQIGNSEGFHHAIGLIVILKHTKVLTFCVTSKYFYHFFAISITCYHLSITI